LDIKTLKTLEFNKIQKMLRDEASFDMSRLLVDDMQPSSSFDEVTLLCNELACAIDLIFKKGNIKANGLAELSAPLKRIEKGGVLSISELLNVGHALRIARNIYYYFDEDNILSKYYSQISYDKAIENHIFDSIESEEKLSDSASAELSAIRRKILDTHAKIREHLNSVIHSSKYQKYLQESIVTIRDGRYVVPVKAEHKSDVPGIVHDMSATGSTLFIEPNTVVNENNKLKELAVQEKNEVEKILLALTAEVSGIVHMLFVNQRNITTLDFIFAKAKLAIKMRAVVPVINDEKKIVINNGRHPLIDENKVVPITVRLGDEFKTLVITGPNTGGKTVTLKTIGLFCIMAACGMGIPATDGTSLCVFENIFADIGDEQSIEQNLSTFSSHMANIVGILESATPDSLVLFDELGAGTDPTEGAALAVSILKYTKDMGMLTAATTHYSEIKMYALTTDGVENASCEFDVNSLRPTYKLLIGIPGKSNAFAICKRLGLPEFIIDNASKQLSEDNIRFEDVISDLEENRKKAEEEHMLAAKYKQETEALRKEIENEKLRLANTRKNLTENANKEAKRILENAKRDADELIKNIRRTRKEKTEQDANRAMNEAMREINEKIKKREQSNILKQKQNTEIPKNLIAGNTVEILDIGQTGTVVSPPKADGSVVVQAGIMKIQTNITNLRIVNQAPQNIVSTGKRGGLKTQSVKSEVDLRGLMLEDALFVTDKYLDDAFFAGLNQVTVIHGKGTGVLRKGIHDMLRRHPHVKSFRLGTFGEGEAGVTVVELKR